MKWSCVVRNFEPHSRPDAGLESFDDAKRAENGEIDGTVCVIDPDTCRPLTLEARRARRPMSPGADRGGKDTNG